MKYTVLGWYAMADMYVTVGNFSTREEAEECKSAQEELPESKFYSMCFYILEK